MKIEIKNRFTNEVIIEGEYKNVKECIKKNRGVDLRGANLRGANLRGVDLREADLWGADLWGADLWGADLQGANLWGVEIKITQKDEIIKSLGIIVKE